MKEAIPDIDLLFRDGTRLRDDVAVKCEKVGRLALPSGILLIADPFYLELATPVPFRFPAGEYEVVLSFASYIYDDFREVAAARLNISDADVVSWKLVPVGEYGCLFGVDSASACFADTTIVDIVERPGMHEELVEKWENFARTCPTHQSIHVGEGEMVLFYTHDGGGMPSYVGRDSSGEIAAIVTLLPRAVFPKDAS